ncbi:MAG: uroporphyrinogen-III synthase [Sporolactobacillus sp.]
MTAETDALFGKKILVTRAADQAAQMAAKIRHYGGEPIAIPVICYRPSTQTELQRFSWLQSVRAADWIILTSQNALDYFMRMTIGVNLSHLKWASVGKKTAERLASYGYSCDFLPDQFTVEKIVQAFGNGEVAARHVVIPVGSLSPIDRFDRLKESGIQVTTCIIYETIACEKSRISLGKALAAQSLDALTFTSPSTVRFFTELLGEKIWPEEMGHCVLAAIGPSTAQALQKIGFPPEVIPVHYTARALIDALADYYSNKRKFER